VRSARSALLPTILATLGLVALFAVGSVMLDSHRSAPVAGELWRRGFLGGEQLRLRPDRRYDLQRWRRFGADETLESGHWDRVGDIVSLVPSTPGARARIMRQAAQDGVRTLYDLGPDGRAPPPGERFERVD
jgi:hypothetical protein